LLSNEYKKYYSVVKLMDFVLKDMIQMKIKYFDMGSSNGLDGVKKFKESFRAKQIERYSYVYKPFFYRLYKLFK
jgi:hypothetical protein